jgi:uncharacterized protein (UPF0179 family)
MKLKRSDLELVMNYIEKEKPDTISISESKSSNLGAAIDFDFEDLEHRTCSITVYEASLNSTPDLTKTMKLNSRVKK